MPTIESRNRKVQLTSALLESTKWHLRVQGVHTVDPSSASLQSCRCFKRAIDILSENGSGKSINGVVGLADDICCMLEASSFVVGSPYVPSSSSNLMSTPTGPKISSWTMRM